LNLLSRIAIVSEHILFDAGNRSNVYTTILQRVGGIDIALKPIAKKAFHKIEVSWRWVDHLLKTVFPGSGGSDLGSSSEL
jgi:hypothetical protein